MAGLFSLHLTMVLGCQGIGVSWAVVLGVLVSWCRGEGRLGHTCVSSPCRFLTLLSLALPLAGTAHVAARGCGSDPRASPLHGAHSATYGSLPLREAERSGPRNRTQGTGGLSHGSLPGTLSRGKSRHLNKLRPLLRGDLDESRTGK